MSKFSEFGNDLYSGKRSINFVGRRNIFYVVAGVMIALAIALPALRGGFNLGIDFKGGSEFRLDGISQTDWPGRKPQARRRRRSSRRANRPPSMQSTALCLTKR